VEEGFVRPAQDVRTSNERAECYTDLARRRGVQAVRNSGRQTIRYAEAYQRVYPQNQNCHDSVSGPSPCDAPIRTVRALGELGDATVHVILPRRLLLSVTVSASPPITS